MKLKENAKVEVRFVENLVFRKRKFSTVGCCLKFSRRLQFSVFLFVDSFNFSFVKVFSTNFADKINTIKNNRKAYYNFISF